MRIFYLPKNLRVTQKLLRNFLIQGLLKLSTLLSKLVLKPRVRFYNLRLRKNNFYGSNSVLSLNLVCKTMSVSSVPKTFLSPGENITAVYFFVASELIFLEDLHLGVRSPTAAADIARGFQPSDGY